MMTIMRMRSAILTIAYYIPGNFSDEGIIVGFGKIPLVYLFFVRPEAGIRAIPGHRLWGMQEAQEN